MLLVDGSWSIGRPNFKTVRNFISRIVEVFDIGPDKVQIGKSSHVGGKMMHICSIDIYYLSNNGFFQVLHNIVEIPGQNGISMLTEQKRLC